MSEETRVREELEGGDPAMVEIAAQLARIAETLESLERGLAQGSIGVRIEGPST